MTILRAGSATDVGRVRNANEDSRLIVADRSLFGVADGMGGHQGGEIASAMAVELAERHTTERSLDSLMEAARVANRAIFEKAGAEPELSGMGTTLVALTLVDGPEGEELAWINVGDSRLYLMRDNELRQLSDDHSLVEELVRDGKLTANEAAYHPKRNIITRALGIDVDVNVDGKTILPLAGDRFVLCSDGLFNEVTVDQITSVLRRLADPDEAAAELVRLANDEGGRDNITVVVVDVVDDDGRAAQIQAAREAAEAAALAAQNDPNADLDALDESLEPALAGRRSSLPASDADYGAESDDLFAGMDRLQSRRLTWRVAIFVLALLGLVGVVAAAIGWQARNTYYVGVADGHVAIFQGRPGGTLWFDPTLNYQTEIDIDDVPDAIVPAIRAQKRFGSLSEANSYVLNLREQVDATTTTTTTTTTTSTTSTTSSTTTAPAATTVPSTTAPAGTPTTAATSTPP